MTYLQDELRRGHTHHMLRAEARDNQYGNRVVIDVHADGHESPTLRFLVELNTLLPDLESYKTSFGVQSAAPSSARVEEARDALESEL